MTEPGAQDADHLESALLFAGRAPLALASLLQLLLHPDALLELSRAAGRRKAGRTEPAQVVAEAALRTPKARRDVVARLLADLPETPPEGATLTADEVLPHLRREVQLAIIRQDLCGPEPEDWQRAIARVQLCGERLVADLEAIHEGREPGERRSASAGKQDASGGQGGADSGGAPTGGQAADLDERLRRLDKELGEMREKFAVERKEKSRLQDELGRERKRFAQLREEFAEARAQAHEADQRAAEKERRLQESTEVSERESALIEELEALRRLVSTSEQKLGFLQEERDDLHGVLQDMDRYLALEPEEVPSLKERPLQPEEEAIRTALAEAVEAGRAPLRVLVVGGGEPQLRHLDKFDEYSKRLGFEGVWRMAEYTSWHKAITQLGSDMERHFDALVILHWNRTTFTRKAREICNQKGQKPCLTCHYEGFVSLRQTLQTCLRQLLDKAE